MRRSSALLLLLLSAALAAGCARDTEALRTYDNNDLELAIGNAAKLGCSCLFVMELDEAACRAWVKASPNVARFSVDRTAKAVDASAFITWHARAHYVDARRGCVLE